MPLFSADPLSRLRTEQQRDPVSAATGIDVVPAVHFGLDLLEQHLLGLDFQSSGVLDGIEGKSKQTLPRVAPGIQVPGIRYRVLR
jgi:hypothetical protein